MKMQTRDTGCPLKGERETVRERGSNSFVFLSFSFCFSFYCYGIYNTEDLNIIKDRTVRYLVQVRGFPKFAEFTDKLISLYKERVPGKTVASLYPAILDWCEKEK